MKDIEEVKSCIEQIYAKDYYLSKWEKVKHKKPLEECSKDELLAPFQDFWESLPDHPSIHRSPFYAICDLAEKYCFGDDE